jgi:uroporphyrinogen-III synthase
MKTILITRPDTMAEPLATALQLLGCSTVIFPTIEIADINLQPVLEIIAHASDYDDFIFISPSTVEQIFKHIPSQHHFTPRMIALGGGTKAALEKHQVAVTLCPVQASSESLLALPELQQVANRQIVIFAGQDGKTLLADTLRARGAIITMAYTHYRRLPDYSLPLAWSAQEIDLSLCTSQESLRHFVTLIETLALSTLYEIPLLVISENMRLEAKQMGFKSAIILADGASDAAIIATLKTLDGF